MIKPGGVGGGGSSILGTARHMLNESSVYLLQPNTAIGKSSMQDDDTNVLNNIEASRFSNMNTTAPNFNHNFDMNLHIIGSQTMRNVSLPP